MATNSKSTKKKSSKNSSNKGKTTEKEGTVTLRNKTNQKQVLILNEEQTVIPPYGVVTVEVDKKDAEVEFVNWISNNIIELVN